MGKKLVAALTLCLVLSVFFAPCDVSASFVGDTGALCRDSAYFKDRGFDSASALLASAKDIYADSFVLVFYSRYNSYCQELIPKIQEWADTNRFPVFGIDQYNKYTREYGYFNAKTSLEGWEEYISRQSFSFPAVFVYNSDARKMTASDGVLSMSVFHNLLNSAGMLDDPYHDYAAAGRSSVQLSQLELFLGTGTGFDLLRAPTRAESLTMLIRLLGKEEEALLSPLPHPFTDVPSWASPYVGYAYYYGITQGTGENTFGSNAAVTSAEFLTFVLRALGYTSGENGDFVWDDPYALSHKAGILPPGVNTKEFLRADMAVICRSALDSKVRDTGITLAQKLVDQRALTPDILRLALNIELTRTPARQEMQTDRWSPAAEIEMRSPKYAVEAIHAAVCQHPTVISLTLPAESTFDWAVYLAQQIHFPAETVSSFEMQITEGRIFIIPQYTAAAGGLAYLTLAGYTPADNERVIADIMRSQLPAIKEAGVDGWAAEYFSTAEILPDSDPLYNDADAALALKRCTNAAISKTLWLANEVLASADRIK